MTENGNPDDAAAESGGLVGAGQTGRFNCQVESGCPREGWYTIL